MELMFKPELYSKLLLSSKIKDHLLTCDSKEDALTVRNTVGKL